VDESNIAFTLVLFQGETVENIVEGEEEEVGGYVFNFLSKVLFPLEADVEQ